jgi:hypothetical protein
MGSQFRKIGYFRAGDQEVLIGKKQIKYTVTLGLKGTEA